MSVAMTSHERIGRMYAKREADRVPVLDNPWAATVDRWRREGMPAGADFREYFGLDVTGFLRIDNSPRYPERVVEETDDWVTRTTNWGVTLRNWKNMASTPEYLDFTVKTPGDWRETKKRMAPAEDRIDWAGLKAYFGDCRIKGAWIEGEIWFGFDVTHSFVVGTERVLVALAEDPEWMMDMFDTQLTLGLALYDRIWDAGYHFDAIVWPDDMGYKQKQFFSMATYREVLKPFHRRVLDWAHARGIVARLHSCGDIRPLVPELVGMGLDGLHPMEVKAGMDPLALKREYGSRLLLHGGINAVLWDQPEAIAAEMRRMVPLLKENGGYMFSSDHSVPSTVSLGAFRDIVELAKKLGTYD